MRITKLEDKAVNLYFDSTMLPPKRRGGLCVAQLVGLAATLGST